MAIPSLMTTGLLPPGIHLCSADEIRTRFGSFQGSDRRPNLIRKFEAFLVEVRASGIIRAVIVNGSFVTSRELPNDIDLLLVLARGHDFRADLGPAQYLVVSRRRVKRVYGLDVFAVEEDSEDYAALVRLFQRVRLQPSLTKGILRIEL